MKAIKYIFVFLAKLFGWLPWIIYRRSKVYHEDKWNKERPLKGGAIIISNHLSLMDYFAVLFTFPFRKIRTLISEVVYNHKFVGFLCSMMDNILVHRERSDLSFMADAEKTLKKNGVISIFPEGHLSKDGSVDTFKPSAVYLALRTGAPIVPMYIEPNYSSFKRSRVIVGKKIYLKDYCDEENPSIEKVRELCEMLRKKVLDLKHLMYLYRKMKTYDLINFKSWFLDLCKAVLWLPNFVVFPVKYHYIDGASKKDRQLKGRALIASKHFFFNDGPILCVNYMKRRVRILVTAEFQNSAKWILDHLRTIPYDRTGNGMDTRCFMEVINMLRANGVVAIYPEGHITNGELLEIQDGISYFAMQTNTPIHFYWMMNPWKPFRRNHIMVSKTIYPSDYFSPEEMKKKENVAVLHEKVKAAILRMHNEGQQYVRKQKNKK